MLRLPAAVPSAICLRPATDARANRDTNSSMRNQPIGKRIPSPQLQPKSERRSYIMPRGDQTGPMGMGPKTGRGAGYCNGFDAPGYVTQPGFGSRSGGGFGRSRGQGRSYGCGQGRGFRQSFVPVGTPGRGRATAHPAPPRLTKKPRCANRPKFWKPGCGRSNSSWPTPAPKPNNPHAQRGKGDFASFPYFRFMDNQYNLCYSKYRNRKSPTRNRTYNVPFPSALA